MFKEADASETRVSVRTSARADAVAITSAFGGGGHARAAGCTVERPARRGGARACWTNASASSTAPMLGVVNLDKPVGPTSHDMVGLMRRLTGTRRIGHAGTLDPLASGVLPILVGAATRFSEELTGRSQALRGGHPARAASATDDAEGPITPVDGPLPAERAIARCARRIRRHLRSAAAGIQRAESRGPHRHRAARAGEPIDLPPRTVTVDSIDVLGIAPRRRLA